LFVCLSVCLQDYAESVQPIIAKFVGMVTYRPQNNQLDYGGKADHISLRLGLGWRYRYQGKWCKQDQILKTKTKTKITRPGHRK